MKYILFIIITIISMIFINNLKAEILNFNNELIIDRKDSYFITLAIASLTILGFLNGIYFNIKNRKISLLLIFSIVIAIAFLIFNNYVLRTQLDYINKLENHIIKTQRASLKERTQHNQEIDVVITNIIGL